eukprot:CAMPEP_0175062686 /NCGR_PEP_ID=MMETSP0052_2-20121109/14311_1 /TAXON_ID=51329 ORGANISM="Polytomella parva, Strain SAG 63-3" /NCGR_SAMPLE_ID=MMETSP0052_2 /ASSEMBLY_ACC=CAM_ASM_000194 /LENGTH=65 /DNA_ID=CAMNT_0016328745 /DNA_START=60 /DNA_END=254 /DNA_ORIENTATION=+
MAMANGNHGSISHPDDVNSMMTNPSTATASPPNIWIQQHQQLQQQQQQQRGRTSHDDVSVRSGNE